jgi:hypothetical protein
MTHEHPVPATDRASMLMSCPANAPSWVDDFPHPPGLPGEIARRRHLALRHDEAYIANLHARFDSGGGEWVETWGFLLTAEEENSIWRVQSQLSAAAAVAAEYLEQLPDDQAGELRLDTAHGGIVVQVTRDAEQVRVDLQSMVGDDVRVTMEAVRFSQAELTLIAARIERLPGLRWNSLGAGNGNGRVEVTVPGDPDEARRLIEDVADPCSFTVTHGDTYPIPAVGTADPSLANAVAALASDQDRCDRAQIPR